MGKSLKEVIKERYGVDTYTPDEVRRHVVSIGMTKEQVRAFYESRSSSTQEVDCIMKVLYPEDYEQH